MTNHELETAYPKYIHCNLIITLVVTVLVQL